MGRRAKEGRVLKRFLELSPEAIEQLTERRDRGFLRDTEPATPARIQ